MGGKQGASVSRLLHKAVFCLVVSIVAAWALVITTTNDFEALDYVLADDARAFVLDVALRTASLLGFFMGIYYFAQLRPRLKRMGQLVGDRW